MYNKFSTLYTFMSKFSYSSSTFIHTYNVKNVGTIFMVGAKLTLTGFNTIH